MSTPERPAGELGGFAPSSSPSSLTSPPAVSPGVSGGVARVPTAPTLPEPDPASLLLVISRMANDLWSEPPAPVSAPNPAPIPALGPSSVSTTTMPSPPMSAQGTSAPQEPAAPFVPASPSQAPLSSASPTPPAAQPPAAHPAGAHPFLGEPDFGPAFSDLSPGLPADFRMSLLESDMESDKESDMESSAHTTPNEPAAPHSNDQAPTAASLPWQVEPLVDLPQAQRRGGFDAHALKREFPILQERVHGLPLVWLDNAATTQKPRAVIERLKTFYERENSNIHRAAHALAARATDAYEQARETVRRTLNASSVRDVVFVRGTTEAINLVAQTFGEKHIGAGDEIVLSHLEHHANIVPWQLLAERKGARLRVIPVDDNGQIVLEAYERLLNDRTRLVAFTQVSNALGTVTPAQQMIEMAHRHGARVLLDGAQSVSHMRVDLQALRPDFFVFSGHKVFGPTGIGALVAPAALLDELPPWQGGGNMIQDVTFERTRFQPAPARFEAGTGNIADAVGLGAALDWLARVGVENIGRHEHELLVYGTQALLRVPGLRIIGTAAEKAGVLSFVVAGHDTQTMASALDKEGIAVRGGHHCAQPILRRFGLESTVRASLAPYNTTEDIDALVAALCRIVGVH